MKTTHTHFGLEKKGIRKERTNGPPLCGRLLDKEANDLDLALVVEAEDTDITVGVGLLALLDFTEDGARVVAPEHGEFPHGPVASIVVARSVEVVNVHRPDLVELEARDPSLVDDVVHLLRDLLLG